MSKDELKPAIIIQNQPEFKEVLTISQNAFSSGLIITYISELKLELDEKGKWHDKAKDAISKIESINLALIEEHEQNKK